jgi:hypothetical protein
MKKIKERFCWFFKIGWESILIEEIKTSQYLIPDFLVTYKNKKTGEIRLDYHASVL